MVARIVVVAAIVAAVGCHQRFSFWKDSVESAEAPIEKKKPQSYAGPTTVAVDGTALALNQPQQDAVYRQGFVDRFEKLLENDRAGAARVWVERHPDVAWDVLREIDRPQGAWVEPLATFHDEHVGAPPQFGWSAVMARRASDPKIDAEFLAARAKSTGLLRNGRFKEAAELDLVSLGEASDQPLVALDAWLQTGVARLLADDPQGAAEAMDRAAAIAATCAPHQAVYARLLLAEAQRRSGDSRGSAETWRRSVVGAADLLARDRPIADPTFWQRALHVQPPGVRLPETIERRIRQLADNSPSAARTVDLERVASSIRSNECDPIVLLMTCVGAWRLERGEPQDALVAFKRAEANCTAPEASDWLRLAEARALLGVGQKTAATSAMMPLIGAEPNAPIARAALADLGSIRMADGAPQQGANMLRRALESEPAVFWPGRSTAEADYGLALIMIGDDANGLAWLDRAKRHFEAEGEVELLAKCLFNEACYYEQQGDKTRLASVEQSLNKLRL